MIQVYTGDGKGKSTAALGLTLRASGAGLRIYFGQFMKTGGTCEERCLRERFPNVLFEPYGGGFVLGKASERQRTLAAEGLEKAKAALLCGDYGLVILDEANVAVSLGLIDEEAVLELMESCPEAVELVLTGRGATEKILERADLVTEMRCVKHYFQQGVAARVGIEL